MGVVRLSKSEITDFQKYSSMLAGNPAFSPSAFDLLETTVLGTAVADVTFSNLNNYSDYKHLQIRSAGAIDFAGDGLITPGLRFNSDSGNNYTRHALIGNGSTVTSTAGTSVSSILLGSFPRNADYNNRFAGMVVDILDFNNTSKYTTVRSLCGVSVTSGTEISLRSGVWMNTNAVTSITIGLTLNLDNGTRLSLYGIK